MSKNENENLEVLKQLQSAIEELNHEKVAWIFKSQVMDLREKATVLFESVLRFAESEKAAAIAAAQEFLIEIKPVIQELNNQKIGA